MVALRMEEGNMKIDEKFHRLTNTALGLMEKVRSSPKGKVRSYAKPLNKIASESTDAIAALMLEEPFDANKRYANLRGQLKKVAENLGLLEKSWIVMPSLGVGNDFWPQSGGGAMLDTGVESLPDMVPAGGIEVGSSEGSSDVHGEARKALKATSISEYVEGLLEK